MLKIIKKNLLPDEMIYDNGVLSYYKLTATEEYQISAYHNWYTNEDTYQVYCTDSETLMSGNMLPSQIPEDIKYIGECLLQVLKELKR